jgi:GH24 family phage-related lysozyme (muramidase)
MNEPAQQQHGPGGNGKLIGGTVALLLGLSGGLAVLNEAVVLETYADPIFLRAGKVLPTACAGDTGPHIQMGRTYTLAECMAMMETRHAETWRRLERCFTKPVPVHVAVSVLSLADNVGVDPVCHSTLVRLANAGHPRERYCLQFTQAVTSYIPHGLPVRLDRQGKLQNTEDLVRAPIGWVRATHRNCRDRRNKCFGLVTRREREQAMCLGDVAKAMQP